MSGGRRGLFFFFSIKKKKNRPTKSRGSKGDTPLNYRRHVEPPHGNTVRRFNFEFRQACACRNIVYCMPFFRLKPYKTAKKAARNFDKLLSAFLGGTLKLQVQIAPSASTRVLRQAQNSHHRMHVLTNVANVRKNCSSAFDKACGTIFRRKLC